jgi:hypothetical protein
MANTPNLDLVVMQAAQAQKEVTFNGNMAIVDAFAGATSVGLSNGANALTEAQSDAGVVLLTGALTAPATATVSSNVSKWTMFVNLTTGGQVVTVVSGSASVVLPYNSMQAVWSSSASVTALGSRHQTTKVVVTISTSVTLTDAQASADIVEFAGTIVLAATVTLPSLAVGQWTFANLTTGGLTVTVQPPSGTGVAVTNGKRCVLYCDGTNVVRVTPDT